jgi:hypothetical protein
MRITYDKEYKDVVLDNAGLKAGKDGYIIDKKTNRPVKDINGEFIKYDQFSGYMKGSLDIIRSDLPSLIKLSRKLRRQ